VGEDTGSREDMDLEVLTEALKRMGREAEVLKPSSESGDGEEGVTLEEMIKWSGLSEEVFREVYLSWVDGLSMYSFSSCGPI
jgi:galactokinase